MKIRSIELPNIKWILIAACLFFITFVTIPILIKLSRFCFNIYDLGVYSQALQYITFDNINPKLSVHGFKIFNDHFDPIIILFAPFARFIPASALAILAESFFVILSTIPVLYLYRIKKIDKSIALFSIIYLLFNRGVINGIFFPAHPTIWAVFPISLLGLFIVLENKLGIILSYIFLLTFREEFPFVGISLGFWFFLQKERKLSLALILISVAWIFLVFGIMPTFADANRSHGANLVSDFLENPWKFIEYFSVINPYKYLLSFVFPLLPLTYLVYKNKSNINWAIIFALIPPLALRAIYGIWGYHYGAPLTAFLLWILMPKNASFVLPKKYLFLSIAFVLILDVFHFGHAGKTYLGYPDGKTCNADQKRLASIHQAMKHLEKSPNVYVFAQGGLIPYLTERRNNVAPLDDPFGYRGLDKGEHFVFFEKDWGITYPSFRDRINRYYKRWKNLKNCQIIINDDHVFLAKGNFLN